MKRSGFKVKVKLYKCKCCSAYYERRSMLQTVCSPACAQAWVESQKVIDERLAARMDRKQDALRRDALKSRSEHLQAASQAFNAWIRWRDRDQPCISCCQFRKHYDAGHYLSVGANATLRFDEDNVHKQCVVCNQHQSGNAVRYRAALMEKIGEERVLRLEGWHAPDKLSLDEIRAIKDRYRCRLRDEKKRLAK